MHYLCFKDALSQKLSTQIGQNKNIVEEATKKERE